MSDPNPRLPNESDMALIRRHLDSLKRQLKDLGPANVLGISKSFHDALDDPDAMRSWESENIGFTVLLAECQLQQLVMELNRESPNMGTLAVQDTAQELESEVVIPTKADMKLIDEKLYGYKEQLRKAGHKGTWPVVDALYHAIHNPEKVGSLPRAKTRFFMSLAYCTLVKMLYEINLEQTEAN